MDASLCLFGLAPCIWFTAEWFIEKCVQRYFKIKNK